MKKNHSRKYRAYFAFFTVLSYSLIILVFYFYIFERALASILIFPALLALIILTTLLWTRSAIKSEIETSSKLRRANEILSGFSHTYQVISATKEIHLLNKDGDAEVSLFFVCRNSEKKLEYTQVQLKTDEQLNIEDIECSFNEVPVKPFDPKRYKVIDMETDELISSLPYRQSFKIKAKKFVPPKSRFTYGYKYKCKRLYPHVTEKGKEHTTIAILHPNEELTFIIFSPEGYVFDKETKFSVYDRDGIEHITEVRRVELESPQYFANHMKALIWELRNPRIADYYRLYFSISPENAKDASKAPEGKKREEAN